MKRKPEPPYVPVNDDLTRLAEEAQRVTARWSPEDKLGKENYATYLEEHYLVDRRADRRRKLAVRASRPLSTIQLDS
jgi:hypothetical protein